MFLLNIILSENNTKVFYVLLVLIALFFAYKAQKDNIYNRKYLILLGIILTSVSMFNLTGIDKDTYMHLYTDSTLKNLFDQEPLFMLGNIVLHYFIPYKYFGIIFMAFSTNFLFFKVLDYYSDKIDFKFAILAFLSIYYFQNFNLMRIAFASMIILYSFRYIDKKEYKKFLIIILITTMIHYSTIVVLIPFLMYYIINVKNYFVEKKYLNFAIFVSFTIYACAIFFFPILGKIPMFSRYDYVFRNITVSNIGILQFGYFIPPFILIVIDLTNHNYERNDSIYFIVWLFIIGFAFDLLSYSVPMLGRLKYFFCLPILIYIPRILKEMNNKSINAIFCFYFMARFYLYFTSYWELDGINIFQLMF